VSYRDAFRPCSRDSSGDLFYNYESKWVSNLGADINTAQPYFINLNNVSFTVPFSFVLYFEAFDCLQLLHLLLSICAASCPGSYSFRFI